MGDMWIYYGSFDSSINLTIFCTFQMRIFHLRNSPNNLIIFVCLSRIKCRINFETYEDPILTQIKWEIRPHLINWQTWSIILARRFPSYKQWEFAAFSNNELRGPKNYNIIIILFCEMKFLFAFCGLTFLVTNFCHLSAQTCKNLFAIADSETVKLVKSQHFSKL